VIVLADMNVALVAACIVHRYSFHCPGAIPPVEIDWSELDSQLTETNEQLEQSEFSAKEFDRQHAELVRQREAHGIFQADIARQYEEYKRCQAEKKQAKK
jgi:hypothetical protein